MLCCPTPRLSFSLISNKNPSIDELKNLDKDVVVLLRQWDKLVLYNDVLYSKLFQNCAVLEYCIHSMMIWITLDVIGLKICSELDSIGQECSQNLKTL